jgi:hypothetical protein
VVADVHEILIQLQLVLEFEGLLNIFLRSLLLFAQSLKLLVLLFDFPNILLKQLHLLLPL